MTKKGFYQPLFHLWMQGGKRQGLGPRTNVLKTCKAVILHGDQRNYLWQKKIAKNNIMYFCFSCISYLSFGTEIQGETKPRPCQILTNNNTLDRFVGYIVFNGRGHQVEDFSGLSLYKIAQRGFSMSDMAIWRPFNSTFIGAPVLKKRLFFFIFSEFWTKFAE